MQLWIDQIRIPLRQKQKEIKNKRTRQTTQLSSNLQNFMITTIKNVYTDSGDKRCKQLIKKRQSSYMSKKKKIS